jgi:hypothetical protein
LEKIKEGMSHEDAQAEARQAVRFAHVAYNLAALPPILRSPVGRTVFIFKGFLLNHLEWLAQITPKQRMRYFSVLAVVGGPRALTYLVKTLPIIGLFGGWDEMDEWLQKKFGKTSHGLLGMAGIGGAPTIVAQLPEIDKLEEWAGPAVGAIVQTYNDAREGDLENTVYKLLPLANSLRQAYNIGTEGHTKNYAGKKTRESDSPFSDMLIFAAGTKPIKESMAVSSAYSTRQDAIEENKEKSEAVNDYLDALKSGDKEDVKEALAELRRLKVTASTIQAARKRKELDAMERSLALFPKRRRKDYDELVSSLDD